MPKKKKDTFDEAQEQGTLLEDFVIYQRIDAFVEAYNPCEESVSTNTFSETALRDFFKAWPCSLGDPLSIYLARLQEHGFNLTVGSSGDLAIFTIEKRVGSKVLALTNMSEEGRVKSEESDGIEKRKTMIYDKKET